MKQITDIKEIQKIELDILVKTVRYFENNNISYFLCGGSMLGAVRHDGFIPWDDDIDVLVPRKDYDRLLSGMSTSTMNEKILSVMKPGMDDYPYPYIKVVNKETLVQDKNIVSQFNNTGVWIDIFPLDHFPDRHIMHKFWLLRLKFWRWAINTHMKPQGLETGGMPANVFFRAVYRLGGGYKNITRRIDAIARSMNRIYKTSMHLGDGTWPESMKDYFEESWITPVFKHRFEEYEFNIPVHYDGYLKHFYGDYMTPPTEEKQRSHFINAYYL